MFLAEEVRIYKDILNSILSKEMAEEMCIFTRLLFFFIASLQIFGTNDKSRVTFFLFCGCLTSKHSARHFVLRWRAGGLANILSLKRRSAYFLCNGPSNGDRPDVPLCNLRQIIQISPQVFHLKSAASYPESAVTLASLPCAFARSYLQHYLPDCNSLSTIWGARAACLLLILFTRLLYFTPCKSEQLFPSACMNQCFPGACTGDCMQLNTSNLCFNYDDLLSVGSSALLSQSASTSPAACVGLYIEFYCLHRRRVVLTAFIKLPWATTMLICSDNNGERSCKDVADMVKVDWVLKGRAYNGKLVKRSWKHCSYFHICSTVLTFGKRTHKAVVYFIICHQLLFRLSIKATTAQLWQFGNVAPDWILYPSMFVQCCFCLAEHYIIWSLAIRSDCLTQYAI